MCQACTDDDHWDCGMQSWCECECDPELAEIDEALRQDSAFAENDDTAEWAEWVEYCDDMYATGTGR